MKLYLVQHGQAVSKEVDADRPLSDDGRAEVEKMTAALGGYDSAPIRLIHSGKTRARQTAEILAAGLTGDGSVEAMTGLAPNDSVEPWIEELRRWDQDTMLVGHLPFMTRLVSALLLGEPARTLVDYQPGSIVCLVRDESGHWLIAWMLRPALVSRNP